MSTASAFQKLLLHLVFVTFMLFSGCATQRAAVTPGTIPEAEKVGQTDAEYGRAVFKALSEKYQIDYNQQRNTRVKTVVGRLAKAAKTNPEDWHVNLFLDDTVKNAAATRGNYIYVWTGILTAVKDDHELSTVIAHEMGHILAGHTRPTFQEELSDMLVDITGLAARSVMIQQGYVSSAAVLAGKASSELVKGFAVNPRSRKLEAEADHIGLFLMARAGYNPEKAVQFWERMSYDPAFAGPGLQFLSTHPSSTERMEKLRSHLPEAIKIYNKDPLSDSFEVDRGPRRGSFEFDGTPVNSQRTPSAPSLKPGAPETWIAQEQWSPVFAKPNKNSPIIYYMYYQDPVIVKSRQHRWLEIVKPVTGYVKSNDFAPK